MRWIALFSFAVLLVLSCISVGCSGKKDKQADSTRTDSSYVSDHFLHDSTPPAEEPVVVEHVTDHKPSKRHASGDNNSEWGSSGSGGHRSSRPAGQPWTSKYQNYQRAGATPRDFAEAMVWHTIRMVYDEEFTSAKSRVLQSDLKEGQYEIAMEVVWSDEWVKSYKVEGVLKVQEDGSGARFEITKKNAEAEALEFTHDNSQSTISVDKI